MVDRAMSASAVRHADRAALWPSVGDNQRGRPASPARSRTPRADGKTYQVSAAAAATNYSLVVIGSNTIGRAMALVSSEIWLPSAWWHRQ
jgi:hypothetical protein